MTTSRHLWLGLGALTAGVACIAILVEWSALRDAVAPFEGAQQIRQLALLLLLLGAAAGLVGGIAAGRGLIGARATLRASAEISRQTLQALPAHIAVLDDRGRITTVNQAWRDFAAANDAGGLPGVAVGSSYLDVCRRAARVDEDAVRALDGIEAVLAGRQAQFSMEYPCHAPNQQRWYLMTVVPLRRSGAVITHLDITERKQTELNARFLNRLQPMLTGTVDPQEMARQALRTLGAHLRTDLAAVGETSADATSMTVQQELRVEGPSVFGTHHMADFLDADARQRLAAGQGIVVTDVASDPQTARHLDRFTDLELRAFVLEPLMSARGLAGILLVAAGTPRTWREDEVQLLHEVAARLYPALEHARAERALRDSQADLERAQAVGHIGSWRLSVHDNRLSWSPECHRIFGVPEGTPLTYQTFLSRVHPDDRDHVDRMWHAALRGEPYDIEHRLLVDDQVKWVRERAELERDEDGQLLGGFGTTQDITDQKRTEAALRESDGRLRLALDAAFLISFEWDVQRNEVRRHVSNSAVLTPTAADAPSTYEAVRAVVHPDDQERFDAAVQRALHSADGRYENEFRVVEPDGRVTWLYERGRVEHDSKGRPQRLVGLSQDISTRKRTEEALREADRRKDDFLATLAHELRNPLAPIRNAVEVLKRRELQDPTAQAARAIIDRQLTHMVRLIDDLLDLSRITRGRLELRTARIALATVLENALEASRPHIEQSGHRLEVDLPVQPVYLEADSVRLAQVFINLLNNAAKYSEHGGTIRLSARRDGTDVVVTVSDTGIGIAAEHLPHLFDSFSHVAPVTGYSEGGLGIGLSLARSLVELHGGRIEAASEGPHKGSRFSVRLPALSEVHSLATDTASKRDQEPLAARRRILVADDNRDIVESLSLLLELGGNQVMTAGDGREAVDIAERERPDVILLDLGMPRMDGTAACRQIRRQPWGKDVRIIALTGWGQEEARQQTCKAGFNAHLVKPVDPGALQRLLDDAPASAAATPPPTSAAD
jgi:PAS domain S-box-containing protein